RERGERALQRGPQAVVDGDLLQIVGGGRRGSGQRILERASFLDEDGPFRRRVEAAIEQRPEDGGGIGVARGGQRGDGPLPFRLAAAGDLVQRARVERDREQRRGEQAHRHSWIWIPNCTRVVLEPPGGSV